MKLRFPLSPPRREDGTLLPAALLALLVVIAGLQLLLTGDPVLPPEGVGRVASGIAAPQLATTTPPPVVMARPLFSPTRSSDNRPLTTGPGGEVGPLGGAAPAGMIARGRAARLFLKLPDGSVRTLGIGGDYLGWRLAGLSGEGATFVRAGERMTMKYGSAAPLARSGGGSDDDENSEEE